MMKVAVLSVACQFLGLSHVAFAETLVRRSETTRPAMMRVQDGITLDVHGESMEGKQATEEKEALSTPFEAVRASIPESAVPSLIQTVEKCKDSAPEHTGFDVNGDDGFLKHAACADLTPHCHNASISKQVRTACPVSCFICLPGGAHDPNHLDGPCYDAKNTGIRFREGKTATCHDLKNYCNHTAIGSQVRQACKLSCGLCELHIEGAYTDSYGKCADLPTHEEPQFKIAGNLAGCADMAQFCQNHPDSYLIRHKCPSSCGVCSNTTPPPKAADAEATTTDAPTCSRRRRWGFCQTRRRRNI